MKKVEEIEKVRRAYHVEGKSMRQIEREYHHSRHTIKKMLASAEAGSYKLKEERAAPVLGAYKKRIAELLEENEKLRGKHRLTGQRIYKLIWKEGYRGSVSGVQVYLWQLRKGKKQVKVYIPLEFEAGTDGQVDWGEAQVLMSGEQITVQIFVMRLCYSRKMFVMAFPSQKQESFFGGHVAGFDHMGGIPARLSYDNLKTAVKRILTGRNREEQERFIVFRSHYLYDSHFCTPGQGHEKGRVEEGVGYVRRNFMTPLLEADNFGELNEQLRQYCLEDDQRRIEREKETIGQAWQTELPHLRPVPVQPYECCREIRARLNGYSQVEVETNRYSVPTDRAVAKLRVKLYPFQVEIYRSDEAEALAIHPRSYGHKEDILDPRHYLALLQQRPGAFNHAKPIRQWRDSWPPIYEKLLTELQKHQPDGAGVRQFIGILRLHQQHPPELIAQAVEQALQYHCAHPDGVQLCLRQLLHPEPVVPTLDLSDQPKLAQVGQQALSLNNYNQLLSNGDQNEQ